MYTKLAFFTIITWKLEKLLRNFTYHRRDFPKVPSLWQQRADLVYDCRRPTKYNHEAGQRLLQHVSLKHNKFVARELLRSETIQAI